MTDFPDVKLKALVSFPATVNDGTGIDAVKTNGTYRFDLNYADFQITPTVSAPDMPNTYNLVWNEERQEFAKVPFALQATSGVSSLGGHTGALTIGTGLQFTGETLGADLATQAEAQAGTSNVDLMTPLRTSQLVIRKSGRIDVTDYGAIGDGLDSSASVNAAAFANAVAALGSNGGQIFLPYGRYHTNDYLANLGASHRGIEFVGVGSGNSQLGGAPPTEVCFTGTTGGLVRLDSSDGIAFRRLALTYNSASYVAGGRIIDLHAVSGATANITFDECPVFGWNASAKNAVLFDVHNSYGVVISGGYYRNAHTGILGAYASGHFCNAFSIGGRAMFDRDLKYPIVAGGEDWQIHDVISEPTNGTTGGAALNFLVASPEGIKCLGVTGASLVDGGDNSNSWINFESATDYGVQGQVYGFTLTRSRLQLGTNGTAVNLGAAGVGVRGGMIVGNHFSCSQAFTTGLIYRASNASDMLVMGNSFNSTSGPGVGRAFVGGLFPDNSLVDNNDGGGLRFTGVATSTGVITPPALTGDVDNYDPTGFASASTLRLDGGAASRNITGFAAPVGANQTGRGLLILNIGTTNNLVLKNNVTSTGANRILASADITVLPLTSARLIYDLTSARWRPC